MHADSYIPPRDADFDNWIVNFDSLITASPADYGLTAPDAVIIAGVTTTWSNAYALAIDPGTRTAPTVAAKDTARASAEATVRPFAINVRNNASVTDLDKVALGLTIPSLTPTPIPAPIVAPSIALLAATVLSMRMTHKQPGAAGKEKPFGAIGVELHISVGLVPAVDPQQAAYWNTVTKSPFIVPFSAADQGKVATFFGRYVTRSGPGGLAQKGPWSAPLALNVI
jgi:hypothetical protein